MTLIKVNFPKLNKNDSLSENDKQIELRNNVETCKVVKVIELGLKEWGVVSESLLADRPELWNKVGGQALSDEDGAKFQEICKEYGVDPDDLESWFDNQFIREWFYRHSYTEVIEVRAERKETFYVDTEGYDYARYVGRLA